MAVTDEQIKTLAGNMAAKKNDRSTSSIFRQFLDSRQKPASAPSAPAVQQPVSRSNQTLGRIDSLVNQQPFQFQGPSAFSYDQNSDPAYQAALASARGNIQQGQADTNARLRAGGQGRSSYSESVANQISAKELGRVSTDVLPQLIAQAYQRYSDDANRGLQVQQLNYGAQQDQIGQLGRLYGMYDQQDFQNPMAEAQLTGNYLPGEARQYIDAILNLKRQAEAPGITAQARAGLSQQADAYRAALQGLGIDPSSYGADQTANQASANFNSGAGIQTLAGRQFELQQRQANLDAARQVGADTGRLITPQDDWGGLFRQATDTNTPLNLYGQQDQRAAQQQQFSQGMMNRQFGADEAQRMFSNSLAIQKFEEDKRQFGLEYAMRENAQEINKDANLRAWAEMGLSLMGTGESKYSGMSPTQVMSAIRNNYTDSVQPTDLNGRPIFGAAPVKTITSDPNRRYQMFLDVVYANLPSDTAENQVLTGLGFTQDEIRQLEQRAAQDSSLGN